MSRASSPQTNSGKLSPHYQLAITRNTVSSSSSSSSRSSVSTSAPPSSSSLLKARAPQQFLQSVWRAGPASLKQTGTSVDRRGSSTSAAALQHSRTEDAATDQHTVRRRGSHPQLRQRSPETVVNNGDFIRAAFDKLMQKASIAVALPSSDAEVDVNKSSHRRLMPAVMGLRTPNPDVPNQTGQQHQCDQDTARRTPPDVSLIEMLQNDDPLGAGVAVRRNTANASRASLSSGISNAYTFPDRSSIVSSRPLLQSDRNSTISYGGSSIATTSAAATPQLPHPARNEGSSAMSSAAPQSRPSESSARWSDPFDDERAQNLRRRSTISGYSVGSADWNSLRRGSLASIGNNSNGSHANQVVQSACPGPPAGVSARWEAWIAAYRDSMLASAQASLPTHHESSIEGRFNAIRLKHDSFPADAISSVPSVNEQVNLFHGLRRQFVARPGSRSETNRLLIIELCHGLEQYSKVLASLWDLCKPSSSGQGQRPSPSRRRASDELDRVEVVANEVDSLVREIIEAVPTFSYALGQGSYGPLPFSLHHLSHISSNTSPRSYLEQVQAIPATSGQGDELEAEEIDTDNWWPQRLKADLRDGLLSEIAEDSPTTSMLPFGTTNPAYQQDGVPASAISVGVELSDTLLEEGRRRWLEYQQRPHQQDTHHYSSRRSN